ncbi:hypothetical protein BIV59_13090 [Bacillus sp. MUM 13]|nr:hypothetical protein BIV59_13090 [Bacillus sp. MUM 13]
MRSKSRYIFQHPPVLHGDADMQTAFIFYFSSITISLPMFIRGKNVPPQATRFKASFKVV